MRKPGAAGMVIEERLSLPNIPSDLQISKVSTLQDTEDFNHVIAHAFQIPLQISQSAIGRFDQLTKPNITACIIKSNGTALAAGMIILEHDIAGIYYVGTIPQARGRGLGELCTRILTNAGFDLGARAVILQASIMGEPLYERIGYKTITHYRWYAIEKRIC